MKSFMVLAGILFSLLWASTGLCEIAYSVDGDGGTKYYDNAGKEVTDAAEIEKYNADAKAKPDTYHYVDPSAPAARQQAEPAQNEEGEAAGSGAKESMPEVIIGPNKTKGTSTGDLLK